MKLLVLIKALAYGSAIVNGKKVYAWMITFAIVLLH